MLKDADYLHIAQQAYIAMEPVMSLYEEPVILPEQSLSWGYLSADQRGMFRKLVRETCLGMHRPPYLMQRYFEILTHKAVPAAIVDSHLCFRLGSHYKYLIETLEILQKHRAGVRTAEQ